MAPGQEPEYRATARIREKETMDFFERYEKSLTFHNRAAGLMEKGRLDEAQELLITALTLYPRELLMDSAVQIDPHIRQSYETLFNNIRIKLETLESLKEGPRLDTHSITSLQELVQKNVLRGTHAEKKPFEEYSPPSAREQSVFKPDRTKPTSSEPAEPVFEEEYFPYPDEVSASVKTSSSGKPPIGEFVIAEKPSITAESQEPASAREEEEDEASEDLEEFINGLDRDFNRALSETGRRKPTTPRRTEPEQKIRPASPMLPDGKAAKPPDFEKEITSAIRIEEDTEEPQHEKEISAGVKTVTPSEHKPVERSKFRSALSELAASIAHTLKKPPAHHEDIPEPAHEPENAEAEPAETDFPELETAESEAPDNEKSEETKENEAAMAETESAHAETSSEEDQPAAMPPVEDQKKTGLLKNLSAKAGYALSRFRKKKKEELPTISVEGPALEPAFKEQAETVLPEEKVVETAPSPPPAAAQSPETDDEEEALLPEDELKKQKEHKAKKPISVRTRINASAVFGAILIVLLFATGIYLLIYNIRESSGMDRLYGKGAAAALAAKTGPEEAVDYAQQYQALLGADDFSRNSMSYIVSDWAKRLRAEKGDPADTIVLLSVFKKQGLRSSALDEELMTALIEQCAADIKAGRTANAGEMFTRALQLASEGGMPEAQAYVYKKQLARLGYLLNTQAALESLARKNSDEAYAAMQGLLSIAAYLPAAERKGIQSVAAKTAERLVNEGQSAMNTGNAALAGKRAQQALDLNPNSRTALALQKRAAARSR